MNAPTQALQPGVYSGMPEEEYFRLPAVSNSRLTPLLKSPAHCRYAMDHPKPPTDAMILGSAVDCLVFSPTLFNERFAVAEQCSRATQKGPRCSKNGVSKVFGEPVWHCSQHLTAGFRYHKDFTVLSADQSSTAYAMAKVIHDHEGAKTLLRCCEEFQLSLVWRENNLLCKGRLDGLSTELKTIIDLKKCQDASPEGFAKSIAQYGYHRQAAMYLRGATYHGIDVKNYVIIAVESEPPNAVALYTLTERPPRTVSNAHETFGRLSPVEYGNHQLLRLLDLYERCEATGKWPGYAEQPVAISLPKWAEYQIEKGE